MKPKSKENVKKAFRILWVIIQVAVGLYSLFSVTFTKDHSKLLEDNLEKEKSLLDTNEKFREKQRQIDEKNKKVEGEKIEIGRR